MCCSGMCCPASVRSAQGRSALPAPSASGPAVPPARLKPQRTSRSPQALLPRQSLPASVHWPPVFLPALLPSISESYIFRLSLISPFSLRFPVFRQNNKGASSASAATPPLLNCQTASVSPVHPCVQAEVLPRWRWVSCCFRKDCCQTGRCWRSCPCFQGLRWSLRSSPRPVLRSPRIRFLRKRSPVSVPIRRLRSGRHRSRQMYSSCH